MIIDTVEISNLGLWENLFLKFDKSINIIQGENGVGKTTLLHMPKKNTFPYQHFLIISSHSLSF